jgi:hypothetical protein
VRQYGLTLAATLAAFAIGFWAGHGTAPAVGGVPAANVGAVAASSTKGVAATKKAAVTTAASNFPAATAKSPAPRVRQPLPASGTPLKESFEPLEAAAAAGDAEAASRLYRDIQRCASARRINATVPRMAEFALNRKTDGMSADELRGRERMMANYSRELAFSNETAALCEGLSDDQINQLFPISMQAGILGDLNAANCFLSGGGAYPFSMPPGLLDHPEWLADYKQNALNVANTAVQAGDWSVVGMLRYAYGNTGGSGNLLAQVTGQDPAMAYRYQKLMSLRASDPKAQATMQAGLDKVAAQITPQARADADAWAQQEFQQYFSSGTQQQAQRYVQPCQSEDLFSPAGVR